jgi:hypothetical protein
MRKLSMFVGVGTLSLLLGFSAAYAQDEPKKEEPKQEEPKAEPKHQDEAKPPKHEDVKPPKGEESRQEEKNRSEAAQQPERGNKHMANGKSGHIPDDKFHANFGRQHTFVVNHPTIVEGQPRFQYGGYWFVMSDPWPSDWAYTDDCYIDYIDGEYFLFDLLHPGMRIVLVVAM